MATTEDWPDRFLAALAKTSNVSLSAELAGVHRDTAYDLRSRDPELARRWADALESAVDDLAAEARRRAMGWEEPVFFGGEQIGAYFKYSDTLMTFLLAAHRPAVYGKNRVEHSGDLRIVVEYADADDPEDHPATPPPGADGDPAEPC